MKITIILNTTDGLIDPPIDEKLITEEETPHLPHKAEDVEAIHRTIQGQNQTPQSNQNNLKFKNKKIKYKY